ncbi:MAG: hypothetical protein HC810_01965 [Acaryochloridaceae cyanobacterium RL_2_7]|nr:hypothetical protein [Acaryochloridaceae cyanobacterium RL_2_7]
MRELRADRWASQFVDPLVLADSLVKVAQSKGNIFIRESVALFGHDAAYGLDIRIKALLNPDLIPQKIPWHGLWLWSIMACCPVLLVPFHH